MIEHKGAILVVEDDLSWQLNYAEILEEEGYLVEVAASKEDADRKLTEHVFDVAIVDLRLVDKDPKNMDGIEVVRLVRDLEISTRVIVQSGYLTADIHTQLEELGVFGILGKDGSPRELTDLVAQAVAADGHEPSLSSKDKQSR
jgi:DNA-binding NtrC family response regulator